MCVAIPVGICVCGAGLNVCDQKCEWASESEWAYLREQCDRGGHCGRGETEDDFMTLRGQDQGQKQRQSQAEAEVEVVWGEGQP